MSRSFLYILFFVSFSCFGQEFKDVPINTGVNMTVAIMDVDAGIVVGDTIYFSPVKENLRTLDLDRFSFTIIIVVLDE